MLRGRSLGQAIGVVALLCATFGVSTASAQVDYEIMASLQFNFSNPGARSLAMAGALTGAGDDATGAWTNPGGLTNITRPEVGVEFRGFDFETPFVDGGRFNGSRRTSASTPSPACVYGNSDNSTHSLSFVSAVVPKSRFAFAFYRTEVANYEADIPTVGTVLRRRPVALHPVDASLLPHLPGQRQPRAADRELRRLRGGPADRPGLGRRRRLVLRLRARLGQPPLRRRPLPADRRGRLLRPAARMTASNVVATEFIEGEDTAVRRQHRRLDQPERQVPHRRQLPPGPEVRHRLPPRGLRRRADQRQRRASSRCPTSSPSACWSSRDRAEHHLRLPPGSVLAADQRHGPRLRRSRTSPSTTTCSTTATSPRRRRVPVHRPAVAAVRHRDPRRLLARPRSPHPLRGRRSRPTACSSSRATARCTTPAAAASCSRSSSSTSASIAPRR